jgi:FMN reductase
MSGAIKNPLDYLWAEFAGKLFGYLSSSHEKGLTAIDQMRTAVRQRYGWSLAYRVAIHGEDDFDRSGAVINPRLASRRRMAARDFVVYGAMVRLQFRRDLIDREPNTFASRYGP